ncbi:MULTISPECIES: DUF413 domain-containing protein [Alteromonadaceae]|uniref:DUF413 domain-containing protein n=1 Tax=Alteromonadaceae TaxID=72275 RepID=UPI001C0A1C7D|nr:MULTISPECIES: DUF413 domain-containing protein [Aliiglaciecola]MBU2878493.1 DUF413 domain-containing protein [Aliiglaciecola lipolytica]MDO6709691.1 DUF413 domain-containing protein [Aliiglaciecola sp. 2_MG-2023]MDO6750767.1 DUF413 domain-containing protein [Aliiglaciecola sp. 1_MG-2023]
MANITRDSLTKRVFSDVKNYPYGFSRSGDFSINESKALSQYGALYAALVDGVISPETEEDQHFIESAFGKVEPETVSERAWLKYQKRISRPKLGSIYGNKPSHLNDDDEDASINDDVELEVDMDS